MSEAEVSYPIIAHMSHTMLWFLRALSGDEIISPPPTPIKAFIDNKSLRSCEPREG